MTFGGPGSRVKQAGSPAQAGMFQRRFVNFDSLFNAISPTELLQSAISAGNGGTVTFQVVPLQSRNVVLDATAWYQQIPVAIGAEFFALAQDGVSWVRGFITGYAASSTYPNAQSVTVCVLDYYFNMNAVVPLGGWSIRIQVLTTGWRLLHAQALNSGTSLTVPVPSDPTQPFANMGFNSLRIELAAISFTVAARSLRIRPSGDATSTNYRSAAADLVTPAPMLNESSTSLLPNAIANQVAANTMDGWVIIENLMGTGGNCPFTAYTYSTATTISTYKAGLYKNGGGPITSIEFTINGTGNFDGNGSVALWVQ